MLKFIRSAPNSTANSQQSRSRHHPSSTAAAPLAPNTVSSAHFFLAVRFLSVSLCSALDHAAVSLAIYVVLTSPTASCPHLLLVDFTTSPLIVHSSTFLHKHNRQVEWTCHTPHTPHMRWGEWICLA